MEALTLRTGARILVRSAVLGLPILGLGAATVAASQPEPPPEDRERPAAATGAAKRPLTVELNEFVRVLEERDRARRELAAVTSRLEEVQAQLNALRELAGGASELGAVVTRLNEQRDELARRLARAEARQLHLQSDLEKTRAELMRLQGIPPALVEIQPEPEPEPPRVVELEPEPPAVEPAGESFELEPPEAVSDRRLEEVVTTIRAWAAAWREQRVDDYLSFYSNDFVPADGTSLELWQAQRRVRLEGPRFIDLTLDRVNPMVSEDRAIVDFVQSYASETFSDVVQKTLELERAGDGWKIVAERAR